MFAAGRRPKPAAIHQAAEKQGGFSVSLDPSTQVEDYESSPGEPKPVWLEPLANGLTFDLMGLAPGPPAELPPRVHSYALAADAADMRWEAVTIRPGPHLTGGHAMLPVVRSLAWLAATLCESEGVEAVVWHPARTWSGADYFRDGVLRWIVWRG